MNQAGFVHLILPKCPRKPKFGPKIYTGWLIWTHLEKPKPIKEYYLWFYTSQKLYYQILGLRCTAMCIGVPEIIPLPK